MANSQDELEILRAQVQSLTMRVHNLEQRVAPESGAARPPAATQEPPPVSTVAPPPRPIAPPPYVNPPQFRTAAPQKTDRDIEGKIGKVWLNRIGIVAILCGVSYFLKYAFDIGLIGPTGRVAIGILAGIGIVVWSENFRRKNYAAFSYSLKALGIGILYLSLWGASQVYHLIPVEAAFAAMIVVTASAVIMAVTQDAELLALYALIGGFSTPVMLSTGQNREAVLFSYVLVLDLGLLALAMFKPWRRLLWVNFLGTAILYVGWYSQYYSVSQRPMTVLFTLAFGAIFAAIPVVTPHDQSRLYKGPSLTLTLLPFFNAGALFLCLFAMYESHKDTLTWFALGLAAFYLLLGSLFKYRSAAPTPATIVIQMLHVSIAIAFITIAIPLKLDSHWITIGWLIESAALLWIAVKTKTNVVRILAGCTLTLAIIRLVLIDNYQTDRLILNARFLTYMVAIAILGGIVWAGSRYAYKKEMPLIHMSAIGLNVLALIALTLEAADYFSRQLQLLQSNGYMSYGYDQKVHDLMLGQNFTFSAIWLVYGAALMAVGFWQKSALVRWQALVLIAFTIGKVFIWDTHELDKIYRILSFVGLGIVLLGISFAYQRDWLKLSIAKKNTGASA
jgi:uncharacterized membrane protein